ncbi:MAG: hypothetical protein ACOCRO_07765 [Halanaerobiales bacterium]
MPEYVEEHMTFKRFREYDDKGHFLKVFKDYNPLEQSFETTSDMYNFMDNDYKKLKSNDQRLFLKAIENTFSDIDFFNGFKNKGE